MFKARRIFYAMVVSLALLQSAGLSAWAQARRAYTVDDLLKIEGVGAVQFSSDGSSIILEYQSPHDEAGNYGVELGGQILQLGPSGKRHAKPLFKHQPGEKYWLGNASPDGRRLLVFQASRQRTRIGIYDFKTKRLTLIDPTPQVGERFEMNSPIWANNHEIILSARSKDWNQYGVRPRPYIADRISVLREKAFAGKASSASVSTIPAAPWFDGYLLKYNVDSENVFVLGQGRFGDFKLSADGKKLAALRLGQRFLHFPVDRLTDYYRFETQLYVFELGSGASQSFLPDTHLSMGSLRWSDDASMLSFFAWNHMTTMAEGAHYVLDPGSGSVVPIRVESFTPSWINIGGYEPLRTPVPAEWLEQKLIVHGELDGSKREQTIDETSLVDDSRRGGSKWYAIDLETMTAKPVNTGGEQSKEVHRLRDGRLLLQSDRNFFIASYAAAPIALEIGEPDSIQILNGGWGDEIEDSIVFITQSSGNHEVRFLELKLDRLQALTVREGDRILAWAPDKSHVITRSDNEDGGALYLRDAYGEASNLFTFNEHLSEIEHPRWETIEYSLADGVETFSCVLLPYNYDPKESYPTIVDVYPGTGKGCRNGSRIQQQPIGSMFQPHSDDLLSANGYLVVRPTNTYERNQVDGTQYGGLKTQVDAALDALVAKGMTDPERIGIWGFSNGSMASLWLAAVSDRYKATVPMFGASSPHLEYYGGASPPRFQMYLGTPLIHLVQYESKSGAMPLSMGRSAMAGPPGYINASPLDRAKHICSPVMMIHSDLDSFSTFNYEALFSALYRLAKRAQLVRYYGEGHGLQSPDNIRDFYKRVLLFFDEHVKSGVPMAPCYPRSENNPKNDSG